MPAGALAGGSVLRRQPLNIAKIADLRMLTEDGLEKHQDPLIDGVDQNDCLALLVLFDGLADPRGGSLLLALMDDGSEWRIDIVRLPPLARQAIKAIRQRVRAWVKVEIELCIQFRV